MRVRAKKRHNGFILSWQLAGKIFCLTALLLSLIIFIVTPRNFGYFPVKSVKIFGVQHIEHHTIEALVAPLVSKSFFVVNVAAIKNRIAELPWVGQVEVRRVWPDQVMIVIHEKEPVACWNETSLLSQTGELFSPAISTFPAGLPKFVGETGEQIKIAKFYVKINQLLAPLHFKIMRVELNTLVGWSVTLNNGMKLNIGHKDILNRISHFVQVYSQVVGDHVADVEYVDLRYPNGMAVRWKSVT